MDTSTVIVVLALVQFGLCVAAVVARIVYVKRKRNSSETTLSRHDRELIASERRCVIPHTNMALMGRSAKARADWIAYAVRGRLSAIRLIQTGERASLKHRGMDLNVATTIAVVYARTADHGNWIPEIRHTLESFEFHGNEWRYWVNADRVRLSCNPNFYYLDQLKTPEMVH